MTLKILIIDDDDLVSISLKKALNKLGFDVEICLQGGEAHDYIKKFEPDIILLDIYLTTHNGIELLKEFRQNGITSPVVMITGYADVNIAVKAIKTGAQDFLLKPIDLEQLKVILGNISEKIELSREVNKLQSILEEDNLTREFFGKSKAIQRILTYAEKIANSADTTVLIEGESGTGKEMIAKYIHQNSQRGNKRFIQINCAAIPKELAESELFGHEKGAFTGAAQKTKLGKFELADSGTILLDEVAELTLDMQVKLLRVLQEKNFYRVGGEKEIKIDVRVIAATNKNLEDEVKKGNFREDLFYRLNVAYTKMPPLRDRQEDIPLLAYSFLNEFTRRFQSEKAMISSDALSLLTSYSWKGNIRELRNVIERGVLLMEDNELRPHDLSIQNVKPSNSIFSDEFVLKVPSNGIKIDTVLKSLIEQTLRITDGNQVQASKVLGLSRSKLRYRMEQLGIHLTKTFK
ncbi:MAG: sigma-54-dependent Fis family transcriptional regulator [Ignavibacteriae bacterium HGW-Ignavibacteriae-2]|jgi:two-component system NtrC family response regulator|nr:MAG: sigma-54-dependent Fis family transcriptional regulator [Ignavibacteriae bacterium HGW-Ignavibacteriae-2]